MEEKVTIFLGMLDFSQKDVIIQTIIKSLP